MGKSVAGGDHFQRMNYLYELATWQTLVLGKHDPGQAMARANVACMDRVGKKTRSRILPQLKRTCCKKCHRVLVPLRTVESSLKEGVLQWNCRCGESKKFPIGSDRSFKTYGERGNLD
ncbi:ribonuclease P protein subunit RPR2 TDEL_0H03320 [Torulaspora delbrueckii]|uniref:Rpr2-domain-containing protein n=1 Tax=Torulaspora delbrueckii TaxID=4950 RepID=G8ZZZ7_TORDE|nr:hypothetical protein TDEL_0H03320 [Torulaspora delbrueckii]CCE94191.1 hypothetical protein TDEL_0H03320 [Torulaspora delbrueckii]